MDLNKIVIGKPVTPSDSTGSGYMDYTALSTAIVSAYNEMKWFGGVALWQYSSDVRGKGMSTIITNLKTLCSEHKDCK